MFLKKIYNAAALITIGTAGFVVGASGHPGAGAMVSGALVLVIALLRPNIFTKEAMVDKRIPFALGAFGTMLIVGAASSCSAYAQPETVYSVPGLTISI